MLEDAALLRAAIAGDHAAASALLMRHDAVLRRRLTRWIEPRFRSLLDAEDILQDAYIEVFRHIRHFELAGDVAFQAWLVTIVQRRYLNARRSLLAAKRGAGMRVEQAKHDSTSLLQLVDVLGRDDSTPSRRAGRGEAEKRLRVALAGVKEEYRQALRMRYMEGRPVREIAEVLRRTERAVHMLCHRGLRALREQMGSASKFLTSR
jgi:RNA polymerase sigma-70 factor, ECF subfamily